MMDDSPEIREDEHEAFFGVILPFLLLILAAVNVSTGTAWTLAGRGAGSLIQPIVHPVAVAGFVTIKIGLAAGLFAWFWMANREKFDHYIVPIQLGAICVAAVGLILVILAFVT